MPRTIENPDQHQSPDYSHYNVGSEVPIFPHGRCLGNIGIITENNRQLGMKVRCKTCSRTDIFPNLKP